MFRGIVLVGFRRLFSTRSRGPVVPVDGRCTRRPRAKRAVSSERPARGRLELRATAAPVVSAEPRARDARDAQDAMTKKSPSGEEKSETVRARVADEATMVAIPVIVRAARAAASLHAQDRIANDYEDDVVALLLSATSRSRPVRRSQRCPPPHLADAHDGRHGGWRRASPDPPAPGSHPRGRYPSGGVHGGLGASSRGPPRRHRRVRVF